MNKQLFFRLFYIALFAKALLFFGSFFIFSHHFSDSTEITGLYVHGKDVEDHLIPLENWWETGTYYRTTERGEKIVAGRPPGYAPLYLPLFVLFGPETARSFFALLCFLIDALSCVGLFWLSLKLISRKAIAFLVFGIYVALPFISVYSNYGKTEPISTAILIFSVLAFFHYSKSSGLKWLIWAGVGIAWATLIRPANALFMVPIGLFLLFQLPHNFKKGILQGLVFLLPFLLLVGGWVLRSSKMEQRLIPIVDREAFATPQVRKLFELISTTNGDIMSWIPNSEARWFAPPGSINYDSNYAASNPFDTSLFSENLTLDSLKELRKLYWKTSDKRHGLTAEDSSFMKKADQILVTYKQERTLWHRVKTETTIFLRFIFIKHTHGTALKASTFWFQIGKVYWLLLYYLVVLGGLAGWVYAFYKGNKALISLGAFCLFYIVIHANVLGMIENRYLAAVMPFFAVLAGYVIHSVFVTFPFVRKRFIHG